MTRGERIGHRIGYRTGAAGASTHAFVRSGRRGAREAWAATRTPVVDPAPVEDPETPVAPAGAVPDPAVAAEPTPALEEPPAAPPAPVEAIPSPAMTPDTARVPTPEMTVEDPDLVVATHCSRCGWSAPASSEEEATTLHDRHWQRFHAQSAQPTVVPLPTQPTEPGPTVPWTRGNTVSYQIPSEIPDHSTLITSMEGVLTELGAGDELAAEMSALEELLGSAASLSERFGRDFGAETLSKVSAFEEAAAQAKTAMESLQAALEAMTDHTQAVKDEATVAVGA